MRIFHIATVADWEAARASGRYTTSTRGRTLAEEGFVHASRGDQWQAVRERWYADVTEPLVLLVVDPARLTSPVVDEPVPGSTETFPHVYGPIDVDAVVRTIPLDGSAPEVGAQDPTVSLPGAEDAAAPAREPSASFSRLYLEELYRNLVTASVVLVLVVGATLAGKALDDDWGPVTGAVLGLLVGVVVVVLLGRRRRAGEEQQP